jgi:hypothetical protein
MKGICAHIDGGQVLIRFRRRIHPFLKSLILLKILYSAALIF